MERLRCGSRPATAFRIDAPALPIAMMPIWGSPLFVSGIWNTGAELPDDAPSAEVAAE